MYQLILVKSAHGKSSRAHNDTGLPVAKRSKRSTCGGLSVIEDSTVEQSDEAAQKHKSRVRQQPGRSTGAVDDEPPTSQSESVSTAEATLASDSIQMDVSFSSNASRSLRVVSQSASTSRSASQSHISFANRQESDKASIKAG